MSRFCSSLMTLLIVLSASLLASNNPKQVATVFPGFTLSPYFGEQTATLYYNSGVRIQIWAPPINSFDPSKPTCLAFYALPNGNTIEQTIGKQLLPNDDWHYDIQHIGAQTRWLRTKINDYNLVTVYCEASASLAWTTWGSTTANASALISVVYRFRQGYVQQVSPVCCTRLAQRRRRVHVRLFQ